MVCASDTHTFLKRSCLSVLEVRCCARTLAGPESVNTHSLAWYLMRALMGLASVFEILTTKANLARENEILTRISNVPIFTVAIEILGVGLNYCNVLPQDQVVLRVPKIEIRQRLVVTRQGGSLITTFQPGPRVPQSTPYCTVPVTPKVYSTSIAWMVSSTACYPLSFLISAFW